MDLFCHDSRPYNFDHKASQTRMCNSTNEIDAYSGPERITNGLAYS